jgi:hypothetical protein
MSSTVFNFLTRNSESFSAHRLPCKFPNGLHTPRYRCSAVTTTNSVPIRRCYITVDPGMRTLQNGFGTYKISLHRKKNITEKMTKNVRFLYHFHL